MTAREIAEDFINTMNPSGWDGSGDKPDDFDTGIVTYEINKDAELDVSYEYDDDYGWEVCYELRDKVDGELLDITTENDVLNSVESMSRDIEYFIKSNSWLNVL